jgi:hypothetical protein
VTFWNEFVVLSDPDRLRRFSIPPNVANLVRFTQSEFFACFLSGRQAIFALRGDVAKPLESRSNFGYA